MARKKIIALALPEGLFDVVPDDERFWHAVARKAQSMLDDYSFQRMDVPPIDLTETFLKPYLGQLTEKDVLVIRGTPFAVRWAMVPAIMRSFLQRGMHVLPHPIKVFSSGYVVRQQHSRPVADWELSVQSIGDNSEAVDAELIFLGCRILEALGIGNFTVHINTSGDAQCRPTYLRALRDWWRTHQKQLCPKCKGLMKDDPIAILRCTQQECIGAAKDAPQILDYLNDECKTHFKRLLEFMDEAGIPYILDPFLVSPLPYQARTVMEFVVDADDQFPGVTVIHGGRFDRLAELLGGSKTPAAGWTLDLKALAERMKLKKPDIPELGIRPKVFLCQLGDAAKRKSLLLFESIRKSGIPIKYSVSRDTIKGQLRMAARWNVPYALLFGQKEALEGSVIVREMETGVQETIPLEKIVDELKKRLKAKQA